MTLSSKGLWLILLMVSSVVLVSNAFVDILSTPWIPCLIIKSKRNINISVNSKTNVHNLGGQRLQIIPACQNLCQTALTPLRLMQGIEGARIESGTPGRLTYKCKGDALGKKRVRSCDLKTETFTALDLRNSSKVYVCVSPFQCFKCNSISIFLWLISLYLPLSLNLYVVTSCHHLCILYVSSSQPYLRLRRDHH